ncbi:MAG: hypothetical protein AB7T49_13965 [Oligoflexales bacterium]
MEFVLAKAPTRVDLVGGTLDLTCLQQVLDHKATVNVGINLPATVKASIANSGWDISSVDQGSGFTGDWQALMKSQTLPLATLVLKHIWNQKLPPLKIVMEGKSPKGAGIGGSSALAIALFRALEAVKRELAGGDFLPESELVRTVQDIETRLIWSPTGCQDYWGAVRGRVNILNYEPGLVRVTTVNPAQLENLEARLILCYSGKSRDSSLNNWAIFRRVFDGDKQIVQSLNNIGELAEKAAASVLKGDWDSLVSCSKEEWQLRKQLWPDIATPETEKIDSLSKSFGATFSRVCGAGGGGVVAVFCDPAKKDTIAKSLAEHSIQVLSTGIARSGLEISYGK